jgi:hypothetical protein
MLRYLRRRAALVEMATADLYRTRFPGHAWRMSVYPPQHSSANASCTTCKRPVKLIEVVIIVPGKTSGLVGQREAASAEMDTATLPFGGREGSQER